jgi:hypothetical protein
MNYRSQRRLRGTFLPSFEARWRCTPRTLVAASTASKHILKALASQSRHAHTLTAMNTYANPTPMSMICKGSDYEVIPRLCFIIHNS